MKRRGGDKSMRKREITAEGKWRRRTTGEILQLLQ